MHVVGGPPAGCELVARGDLLSLLRLYGKIASTGRQYKVSQSYGTARVMGKGISLDHGM